MLLKLVVAAVLTVGLCVSVPSIGSMLLKPYVLPDRVGERRLFQYPLSGRCY